LPQNGQGQESKDRRQKGEIGREEAEAGEKGRETREDQECKNQRVPTSRVLSRDPELTIDRSDAEDVDLDEIFAEYARKQEQFLKVTEAPCDPPRARASSTLIASPSNDNEIFLFGGEFFNGSVASFFNDLYIYFINRDEWRLVTSPNTPLPRSGHAWCRGGNAGGIYLFGGEFSSPKQGTFYHYNDVSSPGDSNLHY